MLPFTLTRTITPTSALLRGAAPSATFKFVNYDDLQFFVEHSDRGLEDLARASGERETTIELDCNSVSTFLPLDHEITTSAIYTSSSTPDQKTLTLILPQAVVESSHMHSKLQSLSLIRKVSTGSVISFYVDLDSASFDLNASELRNVIHEMRTQLSSASSRAKRGVRAFLSVHLNVNQMDVAFFSDPHKGKRQ